MVRQAYMHRLALGRSGLVLAPTETQTQGSGDGDINDGSDANTGVSLGSGYEQQYDDRGYPYNPSTKHMERTYRHACNQILSTIGVCHNVYEVRKRRFPSLAEQTESLAKADRVRQWFRAGLLVLESASTAWLVGVCYRLMTFRRYSGVPVSTILWVESGIVSFGAAFVTGAAYRIARMLVLPAIFAESLRAGIGWYNSKENVEGFMSSDVPLMQRHFLRHLPFGRNAFIVASLAAIPFETMFILDCLSLVPDRLDVTVLCSREIWSNLWHLLKPHPLSTSLKDMLSNIKSMLTAPAVGLFIMQYLRATSYGFLNLHEHLQILRPETEQPNIIYIRNWKGPSDSGASSTQNDSMRYAPALAHSRSSLRDMLAEDVRLIGFWYGQFEVYFKNFFKRKDGAIIMPPLANAMMQTATEVSEPDSDQDYILDDAVRDPVRERHITAEDARNIVEDYRRHLRSNASSEAEVIATNSRYHAYLDESIIADEHNRLRITAFADEPATWFIDHVYLCIDEIVMLPIMSYTLRSIARRYTDLQVKTSAMPLSWLGLRNGVISPGAWLGGRSFGPGMSRFSSILDYGSKIILTGGLIYVCRYLFWEIYSRTLCWAGPRYAHWGLEPIEDPDLIDDLASTTSWTDVDEND